MQPWDRQGDESTKAFAALAAYRVSQAERQRIELDHGAPTPEQIAIAGCLERSDGIEPSEVPEQAISGDMSDVSRSSNGRSRVKGGNAGEGQGERLGVVGSC